LGTSVPQFLLFEPQTRRSARLDAAGAASTSSGSQKDEPKHRVVRHSSQTLSSTSEPLVNAAFLAYPTYIKVQDDVETIRISIFRSVSGADLQMKRPDVKKVKSILEGKKDAKHEIQLR
jgi:hypothetical protein